MSEYVTLLEVEDVKSAGYTMQRAAEQMSQAAGQFNADVTRLVQILDEHATRIEQAVNSDDEGTRR